MTTECTDIIAGISINNIYRKTKLKNRVELINKFSQI